MTRLGWPYTEEETDRKTRIVEEELDTKEIEYRRELGRMILAGRVLLDDEESQEA